MDYYKTQTEFNCGIDLHSRQMYSCVMDPAGEKLLHANIRNNDFDYFLRRVEPWRHDMTVVCESTFNWYWLADACCAAGIEFVLAHSLYLKHIHGGKNKKDRLRRRQTGVRENMNSCPGGAIPIFQLGSRYANPKQKQACNGASTPTTCSWEAGKLVFLEWDAPPRAFRRKLCGRGTVEAPTGKQRNGFIALGHNEQKGKSILT